MPEDEVAGDEGEDEQDDEDAAVRHGGDMQLKHVESTVGGFVDVAPVAGFEVEVVVVSVVALDSPPVTHVGKLKRTRVDRRGSGKQLAVGLTEAEKVDTAASLRKRLFRIQTSLAPSTRTAYDLRDGLTPMMMPRCFHSRVCMS